MDWSGAVEDCDGINTNDKYKLDSGYDAIALTTPEVINSTVGMLLNGTLIWVVSLVGSTRSRNRPRRPRGCGRRWCRPRCGIRSR